jgi:hypothetical protein
MTSRTLARTRLTTMTAAIDSLAKATVLEMAMAIVQVAREKKMTYQFRSPIMMMAMAD